MAFKFQIKTGITDPASGTSLAAGELGFDTSNKIFHIGTGTTVYKIGSQSIYDTVVNATSAATPNTLVKRDGSGKFSVPTTGLVSTDIVTKGYVDSAIQGLDIKESVRAATTANITLSAPQTIDGVSVIAGNRVLVKNQTTTSDNGIYIVAAGPWTRSSDAASGMISSGNFVFVEEGTANADTGWVVSSSGNYASAQTWTQFSRAGLVTVTAAASKQLQVTAQANGNYEVNITPGAAGTYLKVASGGTTLEWGSLSLNFNGSITSSPSWYAPTVAGTAGQYLKSSGVNIAPVWDSGLSASAATALTSTGTNLVKESAVYYGLATINGADQTRSVSVYAPTAVGTAGQYLRSSGTTAPTWGTYYSPASAGTSGQFLTTNGTALSWTDTLVCGTY